MSKIGLVLEGGGMKCAYTAGILDAMMDNGITFDYGIGVSAGSANVRARESKLLEFYCRTDFNKYPFLYRSYQ